MGVKQNEYELDAAKTHYGSMNPREMHTEIQRRTKLLYGQQNLIRMLEKSD